MFAQLKEKLQDNDLVLTISQKGDQMSVIVQINSKKKELEELHPFSMSGTAEEIEANFMEAISKPLAAINGFTIKGVDKVIEQVKEAEKQPELKVAAKSTAKLKAEKVKTLSDKELLANAKKLFDEKKYGEAKVIFEDLVSRNPDNKQYKFAQENNEKWMKASAALNNEESKTVIQPVASATQPNIKALAEETIEEEFIATEGPEESSDNDFDLDL